MKEYSVLDNFEENRIQRELQCIEMYDPLFYLLEEKDDKHFSNRTLTCAYNDSCTRILEGSF